MTDFKPGELVKVYYSVPNGLQNRIVQIKNPIYGENMRTVGYYVASVISHEENRLFVINTYTQVRHYVHPRQCRKTSATPVQA